MDQADPRKGSSAGSWEEKKKEQQKQNVSKISKAISQTAVGTAPLPTLLMGKLLNPQPYESPVEGWVEGVYHPLRQPGHLIELPHPGSGRSVSSGPLWVNRISRVSPRGRKFHCRSPEASGDRYIDLLLGEDMGRSNTLE